MISYNNRTYEQAKSEVLSYFAELLPEVTDMTFGNPLIKASHVWLALSEQINYYIDDNANESFVQYARRYRSLIAHAKSKGYKIRLSNPSVVTVTLSTTLPSVTIPSNTVVTAGDITFLTLNSVTLNADTKTVDVVQYDDDESSVSISNGIKNLQISIPFNAVEGLVSVVVNNEVWTHVDTLAYSKSNDKHFTTTLTKDGVPVVLFGDGVCGLVPINGYTIEVSCKTTRGADGNIGAREITSISVLGVTSTNVSPASGGKSIDSLKDIRRGIQRLSRTNGVAVTAQDLIDVAESVNGVARAGVLAQSGKPIELYIIPVGGIVATNTLKQAVLDKVNSRRVLGRSVSVLNAGVVYLKLDIRVRLSGQFDQDIVRAEILNKLFEKYNAENQGIGDAVFLSDIYEIVESTRGVLSSDVVYMSHIPYARPIGLSSPLSYDISVAIDANETVSWRIVAMQDSQYSLYRNNAFVGVFNYDTPYTYKEITYTINGTYTAGDSWDFKTYKGFGNINLQEQSIISFDFDNTSITFV